LESGHDQQLNLLEFTNLLRSEFVKTGIEPAHLDAQAKKVFAKLDTNGNGFIDLEEYKRGIKQIKTFLHPHNNAARAAEGLAHTAANLPVGGPLVKVSNNIGASISWCLWPKEAVANSQEEHQLVQHNPEDELISDGTSHSAATLLFCGVGIFFVLLVVTMFAPYILLWIGVISGESCEQPLYECCIALVVITSVNLGVFSTQVHSLRSSEADASLASGNCIERIASGTKGHGLSVESTTPTLDLIGNLASLAQLVAFLVGLHFFNEAGGLFGEPGGTCETEANTLFSMVYMYYWWSFISICLILAVLIIFICHGCCTGNFIR